MVSRWPVVATLPVAEEDCDEDGMLTEASLLRFFERVRAMYFDLCLTVDGSSVEVLGSRVERGRAGITGGGVTVSVNVVEVFPDRFTMTARYRSLGPSDSTAGAAWCSLSPGGEVTKEMRDEFIALAHTAKHTH